MRRAALLAVLLTLAQSACTISVKSNGQELVPSWVPAVATALLVAVVVYILIRRRK